jgi:hypothetical protein
MAKNLPHRAGPRWLRHPKQTSAVGRPKMGIEALEDCSMIDIIQSICALRSKSSKLEAAPIFSISPFSGPSGKPLIHLPQHCNQVCAISPFPIFSSLFEDGLHQISRPIHVDAVLERQLIGQELQRNDLENR